VIVGENVANEWLMLQILENVCKTTLFQPHFIAFVQKRYEWWKRRWRNWELVIWSLELGARN
jgi:hypothetical protein